MYRVSWGSRRQTRCKITVFKKNRWVPQAASCNSLHKHWDSESWMLSSFGNPLEILISSITPLSLFFLRLCSHSFFWILILFWASCGWFMQVNRLYPLSSTCLFHHFWKFTHIVIEWSCGVNDISKLLEFLYKYWMHSIPVGGVGEACKIHSKSLWEV